MPVTDLELEAETKAESLPSGRDAVASCPNRSRYRVGVAVGLAAWAAVVLVYYALRRDTDVSPALSAMAGRSVPILQAVGLIALYSPMIHHRWISRTASRSALTDCLRTLGGCVVALAFVALGLLLAGWVTPVAFWSMGLIAGVTHVRHLAPWLRRVGQARGEFLRECRLLPAWGTVVIAGLALLVSGLPAVAQDSLLYHLAVPQHWLDRGGFAELPGNVYSHFPMNTELLYLSGLVVGSEATAKVFHWILYVAAALTVRQLARRLGAGRDADWAMLIFASIPTVFRVSTWAYVEMALVFSLGLAWLSLGAGGAIHGSGRRSGAMKMPRIIEAAVLLGFACGVKYTALPIALAAAIYVAIRAGRGARLHATSWMVFGSALVGGFWYVRNWVETGNPFFPFAYSWFGGPGWDGERSELLAASLAEWGRWSWDLPWAITQGGVFDSIERFDGVIGPVFLASVPLVVWGCIRRPSLRPTAGLAALLLIGWLSATLQARFIVPALAILAALAPAAWRTLGVGFAKWARAATVLGVLLCAPSILLIVVQEAPLAHALGLESTERALDRRLPGGDAALFRQIPEVVPSDGKILFGASGNPTYLCRRPYHADSIVENHTLREILAWSRTPEQVRDEFARRGFTHLLFRFELVFDPEGSRSDLTVVEQARLEETLTRYGRVVAQAGTTFLFQVDRSADSSQGGTR